MIEPLKTLTAVLLLSVVATACARASGTTGGVPYVAGSDKPVSSGPIPAEPVPGVGVLPTPTPIAPRPGMAGVHPIPWEHVDVAQDDRTLTVSYTTGVAPCYVLDHVDVAATATTVTVTLYQGHDPGSKGVACIDIGVFASVSEVLAEPLAGRRIVDGAAKSAF